MTTVISTTFFNYLDEEVVSEEDSDVSLVEDVVAELEVDEVELDDVFVSAASIKVDKILLKDLSTIFTF